MRSRGTIQILSSSLVLLANKVGGIYSQACSSESTLIIYILEWIYRKHSWFYCSHCDERLSKNLYFQHRRLYYSYRTRKWKRDETPCDHTQMDELFFSDNEIAAEPSGDSDNDQVLPSKTTDKKSLLFLSYWIRWTFEDDYLDQTQCIRVDTSSRESESTYNQVLKLIVVC